MGNYSVDRTKLLPTSKRQATLRMVKSTPPMTGIGCCLERLKSNQIFQGRLQLVPAVFQRGGLSPDPR